MRESANAKRTSLPYSLPFIDIKVRPTSNVAMSPKRNYVTQIVKLMLGMR